MLLYHHCRGLNAVVCGSVSASRVHSEPVFNAEIPPVL